MGRHSRDKGKRGEREVIALARAAGLTAERTWHLAQSGDAVERRCDVLIAGRPTQVKVAADGFRTLYDALDGVEMAFLRSDRRPWLALLPAERLLMLLAQQVPEGQSLKATGGRASEAAPCAQPRRGLSA